MKGKAIFKKIVAVVCVLALTFCLVDTMDFVAKATGENTNTYIPVTLADLTDNYTAGNVVNSYAKFTKSQSLTWENTEFEGMFKFDFTGQNEANMIILGSTTASRGLKIFINTNNQVQVRLIDNGNAGKARYIDKYITATDLDVESLKTELKMRVKFDFENVDNTANTADVSITVQLNDYSVVLSQTAFQLDYMKRVAWLIGTASYPLCHDSKYETTYVRLSDLTDNYQPGEVSDRNGKFTKAKDKNWNHTEFEGKFKFDFTGTNEENMLILGSVTAGRGLKIFTNADNQLQLRLIDNGNPGEKARYVDEFLTATDLGVTDLKAELNLKVNFDFANVDETRRVADVMVRVQINEHTVTLSQTAFQLEYMRRVAWLIGKANYSLYHNSQYVEIPREYETVYLSDLTDNYVAGNVTNAYAKYTKCADKNWDGVQFEGKFKFDFSGQNEANMLILGSTSASRGLKISINDSNQLQLRLVDNGNPGGKARFIDEFITAADLGVSDLNTELALTVKFDFSKVNTVANTADVKINVLINEYAVTLSQTAFQLDYMKRVAWLIGKESYPLYHNSQLPQEPKEYEIVHLSDLTDDYKAGNITNAYTMFTKCESMNWGGTQFEGEFKFDFTGTNEANMFVLGNTAKGGLKIYINSNNQLQIRLLDYANAGGTARYIDKFVVAEDFGNTSLKQKLLLKITFDFANIDEATNTADVVINVSINEYTVTLMQTAFQLEYMKRVVKLVGTTAYPIYHNSDTSVEDEPEGVNPAPIVDKKFKEINFDSYEIPSGTYRYADKKLSAKGQMELNNLDRVIFTDTVQFSDTPGAWICMGGVSTAWQGLNIVSVAEGRLQLKAATGNPFEPILFDSETAGTKLTGKDITMMLSFEYIDVDKDGKKNDVRLAIWFDGKAYENRYFYLKDFTEQLGSYMGVYIENEETYLTIKTKTLGNVELEPTLNQRFAKVNFDSYEIPSGTYRYADKKLSAKGQMELNNLDRVIFTDTVQFSDAPGAWICMGGVSTAWQGLNIVSVAEGELQLKAATGNPFTPITFKSAYAGVDLTGQDIEMTLSFEYVDFDRDGKKNDVKLGVWFNGKCYRNKWYYLKDFAEQLGSYMGVYIANEEAYLTIKTKDYSLLGSMGPKPTLDNSFTKVNFDSFWIKNGTYRYADNRLSAKGQMELKNLHRVIFSDTLQFSDAPGACICLGGVNTAWEGLNILSVAEGELQLKAATGNPFTPITFKSKYAGVDLTGQDIEMTLSFEYVDSDKDGKKDDVKLAVWFNGKCYRNRWYYLKDFAKQLGNHMGIYIPNKETTLTVKTYKEPGDFGEFGFTENWRAELRLK